MIHYDSPFFGGAKAKLDKKLPFFLLGKQGTVAVSGFVRAKVLIRFCSFLQPKILGHSDLEWATSHCFCSIVRKLPNMSIYLYMQYIIYVQSAYIFIYVYVYIYNSAYRFCLRDRDALLFAFEDGSQIQQLCGKGKIKEDQSLIRSV